MQVSQAEDGPTSPAWLISTCPKLAEEVNNLVPKLVDALDEDLKSCGGTPATTSWPNLGKLGIKSSKNLLLNKNYSGEIVVITNREEAVRLSDRYAPEHLEVLTSDLDYYHNNLTNYGSLFLGEGSTVTHGDKASGPNHVLPTRRVGRYTGGLSVEKFLKKLTWQKLSQESNK